MKKIDYAFFVYLLADEQDIEEIQRLYRTYPRHANLYIENIIEAKEQADANPKTMIWNRYYLLNMDRYLEAAE